jgi:hypothetical protein
MRCAPLGLNTKIHSNIWCLLFLVCHLLGLGGKIAQEQDGLQHGELQHL